MAEVVDSIIADLIVRGVDQYEANFNRASAAHGKFQKSVDGLKAQTFDLSAEGQKYKAGLDAISGAEEQTTAKITRTRKARVDSANQTAAAETSAAKKATDAQIAEADRLDKRQAQLERNAVTREAQRRAKGPTIIGERTTGGVNADHGEHSTTGPVADPGRRSDPNNIPGTSAATRAKLEQDRGDYGLAKQKAVNDVLIARTELQERLKVANEADAEIIRAQITELNLASSYERAGLSAKEASLRLDRELLVIETQRAARAKETADDAARQALIRTSSSEVADLRSRAAVTPKGDDRTTLQDQIAFINRRNIALREGLTIDEADIRANTEVLALQKYRTEQAEKQALVQGGTGKNVARFAEGAGLGRSFGSTATVAGIAAAAGVAAGAEAVASATEYAKALSDVSKQAGISTDALQVYQHAAVAAGAKSTDFDMAISALSNNLGKARTGSEQQAKAFTALGISFKGTETAGQLLPTIIDRLSSVADQSKRAAVETELFNESGRKLDGVFSGGNQRISELAASLERTGAILSSSDIAKLNDTADKLAAVKAQLQVDLAQIVAGNADAILKLAASFETLVDKIRGAVSAFEQFNQTQGHSGLINTDFLAKPEPAKAQSFGDYLYSQVSRASGAATGFLRGRIAGKLPAAASNSLAGLSASASNFDVQPGSVNNKLLDSLNAPKGRKGKSADQLANEADERTKRFNDTLAKYQDEQLKALQQQTSDEAERYQAQRDEIERDSAKQIADLQTQARIDTRKAPSDARLIAARLAQAIEAEKAAAGEKEAVVNLQENLSAIRRDTEARTAALDFSNQILQDGQRSTDTSAQRQKTQLEILANEEKIKELTAQEVLRRAAQGDPTITKGDIEQATTTIANIPAETAARAGQIRDQTRSPGQQYADSLKTNSDTIQDSEVNALKQFNTELDKSVSSALHLHGILGSIVDDLIDMAVKQALIKPLAGALFGGSGGTGGLGSLGGLLGGSGASGGLGGLLGKLGGLFGLGGAGASSGIGALIGGAAPSAISGFSIDSSLLALPGLAGGGSIGVMGNAGTDRNVMSINGQPVARINQGETINVVPTNQRVNSAAGNNAMPLHQTINIDNRSSLTPADFASQIISVSADHANRVAAQSGRSAVQASPAQVRQTQVLKG